MGEHNPYQSPESMPDASTVPSVANMSGLWVAAFPLAIKIIPAMVLLSVMVSVLLIPAMIIGAVFPNLIGFIINLVYEIILMSFYFGCAAKYVYDSSKGFPNIGDAINAGKEKIVSLTGATVLLIIAVVVAAIPLKIFGSVLQQAGILFPPVVILVIGIAIVFYFLAIILRLSYTSLRIVVDDEHALDSMKGSFDMTRGSLAHLFFIYLPIMTFVFALGGFFYLFPEIPVHIVNSLGYATFAMVLMASLILSAYYQTLLVMSYDFIKARRANM